MRTRQHVFGWARLVIGVLGVLLLLISIAGVWTVEGRVSRAVDNACTKLHAAVNTVQAGVGKTQEQIRASRVTSEDVGKALKHWTKREVGQRIAERLDLEYKLDQMDAVLHRADAWVQTSATSLELVAQAIALANDTGASIPTDSLNTVREEIVGIQIQLNKAIALVTEVRKRTQGENDAPSADGRLEKAARIAIQIAASLGAIETRLERFAGSLEPLQARIDQTNWRLSWWSFAVGVGLTLLLVWMLAGQVALCHIGRESITNQSAG